MDWSKERLQARIQKEVEREIDMKLSEIDEETLARIYQEAVEERVCLFVQEKLSMFSSLEEQKETTSVKNEDEEVEKFIQRVQEALSELDKEHEPPVTLEEVAITILEEDGSYVEILPSNERVVGSLESVFTPLPKESDNFEPPEKIKAEFLENIVKADHQTHVSKGIKEEFIRGLSQTNQVLNHSPKRIKEDFIHGLTHEDKDPYSIKKIEESLIQRSMDGDLDDDL